MIFDSLVRYYNRLYEKEAVPPFGFSNEDIGFSIAITKDGEMIGDPIDLRNKVTATQFDYKLSVVPYSNKVNVRSGNAADMPNFMVDKADYIFGMSGNTRKDKHHESFTKLVNEICKESYDDGINAVKNFLNKWDIAESTNLTAWKDISGINGKWIAFRLEDERQFIHERAEVKKVWLKHLEKEEYENGFSFVEGEFLPIQVQYSQYKFGSGASLVSFNDSAYESYRKKRGENAPISVDAEFKSATALKYLLRSRTQRIKIGDATTVFWTERDSPVETFLGQIFNPSQDSSDNVQIEQFLKAAKRGVKPQEPDFDMRFYILGLSLNKARLAIRFWHVCSVAQLMDRIGRHFNDLEIEYYSDKDIRYPGVWHLLKETARETKDISPLLGGALMRSILDGTNYPMNLFLGVLSRIKADQAKTNNKTGRPVPNVNYLRASILKAVLKRNFNMEVPMSLDKENKNIAYLLGRLFAVLEKAQKDALGVNINATIKDRFYSSASTCPAGVFPRLLRLANHHMEKAEYGYISERRIGEIMESINSFPHHLNIQQQGLFAIAYYQQKNDLYKTNESKSEGEK